MKNLTFKAYRQPPRGKDQPQQDGAIDPQQSSYLKRREQVRKAQRTHRERKEAYIKSLESEVLQLRTNETKILQETKGLYAEIGRLQRLLAENGIEASPSRYDPAPLSSGDDFPTTTSIVSVRRNRKLDQIHVAGSTSQIETDDFFLSEGSSNTSTGRWKFNFFGKKDTYPSDGGASQGQISNPATSPNSRIEEATATSTTVIQMDLSTVGMEFVLTLESPCLHHTQGNPKDPLAPSGHALTATAPLLFQAPSASVSQLPSGTWETPSLGLEKLLDLASNLELSDEMTPVQAWNYVRRHDEFSRIDVRILRKLTQDLLGEVKCHGFGAVIEQSVLENLVFDAFVVGRVF